MVRETPGYVIPLHNPNAGDSCCSRRAIPTSGATPISSPSFWMPEIPWSKTTRWAGSALRNSTSSLSTSSTPPKQ